MRNIGKWGAVVVLALALAAMVGVLSRNNRAMAGTDLRTMAACGFCQGTGRGAFACTMCKGSGRNNGFRCSFCSGSGFTKCSGCNGTGQR